MFNADRKIWNIFITYSFSLTVLSCVEFRTFTEVGGGAVGSFKANAIIVTRIWHTWTTWK